MTWISLALVSSMAFALGDFLMAWSKNLSQPMIIFTLYTILMGFMVLLYAGSISHQLINQVKSLQLRDWLTVLGIALFYLLAYYAHFMAVRQAPNAGFASALIGLHIVFLTLLARILLGSPVTTKAWIGILMVVSGSFMVATYSSGDLV